MLTGLFTHFYNTTMAALRQLGSMSYPDRRPDKSPNTPSNHQRLIALGLVDKHNEPDSDKLPITFICSISCQPLNTPMMIDLLKAHVIDKQTFEEIRAINESGLRLNPYSRQPIYPLTQFSKQQQYDKINLLKNHINTIYPFINLTNLLEKARQAFISYQRCLSSKLNDQCLEKHNQALQAASLNNEDMTTALEEAEKLFKINKWPVSQEKLQKKAVYLTQLTALAKRGIPYKKAVTLLRLLITIHQLEADIDRYNLEIEITEQIERFLTERETLQKLETALTKLSKEYDQAKDNIQWIAIRECPFNPYRLQFTGLQETELNKSFKHKHQALLTQLKDTLEAHIEFMTDIIIHNDPDLSDPVEIGRA